MIVFALLPIMPLPERLILAGIGALLTCWLTGRGSRLLGRLLAALVGTWALMCLLRLWEMWLAPFEWWDRTGLLSFLAGCLIGLAAGCFPLGSSSRSGKDSAETTTAASQGGGKDAVS